MKHLVASSSNGDQLPFVNETVDDLELLERLLEDKEMNIDKTIAKLRGVKTGQCSRKRNPPGSGLWIWDAKAKEKSPELVIYTLYYEIYDGPEIVTLQINV